MIAGRIKSRLPRLRQWLWDGMAVFGIAMAVYLSCFHVSYMVSNSMAPTLQGRDRDSGDTVLSERMTFRIRNPRRWEIVAYHGLEDAVVMKRVIGLPGETVKLREDGVFLINGEPIERPPSLANVRYYRYGSLMEDTPAKCGDGYFVLGDDSRDSDDSRYNGPVSPDDIIARPLCIMAPPNRRGLVQP
jgi:signal peptidase I